MLLNQDVPVQSRDSTNFYTQVRKLVVLENLDVLCLNCNQPLTIDQGLPAIEEQDEEESKS